MPPTDAWGWLTMAYPAEGGRRPRFRATAYAALWTSLSALLPGLAHIRAGKRTAGAGILGVFLLFAAAVGTAIYRLRDDLSWQAWLAAQPYWVEVGSPLAP